MKHVVNMIKAAGLLAGMVAFSGVGWAQCKIAVVDMQEAVLGSNEGKVQSAKFDTRVEEWQGKLKKLQDDLDTAQKKLQAQGAVASQAAIADLNKTIKEKQKDIERMQEDATKDVDEYRESLLKPIMDSADAITQALSAEKSFGIVMDRSAQNTSIVYASKDCDITNEVKTRMNAKAAAPVVKKDTTPPPGGNSGGGKSPPK